MRFYMYNRFSIRYSLHLEGLCLLYPTLNRIPSIATPAGRGKTAISSVISWLGKFLSLQYISAFIKDAKEPLYVASLLCNFKNNLSIIKVNIK